MASGADLLTTIMRHQHQLQIVSFGVDPQTLEGEARDHYVSAMSTALVVEIGEALQEISWKPWASGIWLHREAFLVEMIDALHFWINLVLLATTDAEEVARVYFNKADINAQRQLDGYTGQDKCPTCGR